MARMHYYSFIEGVVPEEGGIPKNNLYNYTIVWNNDSLNGVVRDIGREGRLSTGSSLVDISIDLVDGKILQTSISVLSNIVLEDLDTNPIVNSLDSIPWFDFLDVDQQEFMISQIRSLPEDVDVCYRYGIE